MIVDGRTITGRIADVFAVLLEHEHEIESVDTGEIRAHVAPGGISVFVGRQYGRRKPRAVAADPSPVCTT